MNVLTHMTCYLVCYSHLCAAGWVGYLRYGLPATIQSCTESWMYEVVIFMAGEHDVCFEQGAFSPPLADCGVHLLWLLQPYRSMRLPLSAAGDLERAGNAELSRCARICIEWIIMPWPIHELCQRCCWLGHVVMPASLPQHHVQAHTSISELHCCLC